MMPWDLILLALVAFGALSGWVLAELELRDAHRDMDDLERDLDVALGWSRPQPTVVHPTLHVVESDER